MTVLWAILPLALAAGTALALVQLRGFADAAADVRFELHRFGEVQVAVAQMRRADADARASARGHR
jgi:hypothetical protein